MLLRLALVMSLLTAGLRAVPSSFTAYFREPKAERVVVSPDGRHLAYDDVPRDGRPGRIFILALDLSHGAREVALEDGPAGRSGADRRDRVRFLGWASPARLVVGTQLGRVYSIDVNGLGERVFRPVRGERLAADGTESEEPPPAPLARVASLPAGDPLHAILELHTGEDVDASSPVGLVRFNVETGASETLQFGASWGGSGRMLYDPAGCARILLGSPDSERPRYCLSLAPKGWSRWNELDSVVPIPGAAFRLNPDVPGAPRAFPLGFDGVGTLVVAVTGEQGTTTIRKVDLASRRVSDAGVNLPPGTFVPEDPSLENSPLVVDRASGRLLGIRTHGLHPGTLWMDAGLAALQGRIEREFPGRRVRIVSWDDSRSVLVVGVSSASDLGRYFVVRSDAPDLPLEVVRRLPRLDLNDMAPTHLVDRVVAPGSRVQAAVTLPVSGRHGRFPVVFVLSEDPSDEAPSGYRAEAQALASRGWAVVWVGPLLSKVGGEGSPSEPAPPPAASALLEALAQSLGKDYPLDTQHMAIVGEGFGGLMAASIAALSPNRFSGCASLGPASDWKGWARLAVRQPMAAYQRARREAIARRLSADPHGQLSGNAVAILTQKSAVPAFEARGFKAEGYKPAPQSETVSAEQRASVYWQLCEFLQARGFPSVGQEGGWIPW